MKNIVIIISVLLLGFCGCQKESAIIPCAKFTTNLVGDSIPKKTKFTIYLDQARGEYLVYFKGDVKSRTYNKNNLTATGSMIPENADSVQVTTYINPGVYTFTVLARSFGNWGKEELEAVDSLRIKVY